MEREIHTGYACVSYTLVSYHHHHVCTRGEGRDWVSRCGCACTCVCEGERKMRSRCSRQVSAGSRLESRANYPLLRFPSHSLLSSKFLLFDRLLAYLPTYLPTFLSTYLLVLLVLSFVFFFFLLLLFFFFYYASSLPLVIFFFLRCQVRSLYTPSVVRVTLHLPSPSHVHPALSRRIGQNASLSQTPQRLPLPCHCDLRGKRGKSFPRM